MYLGLQSEKCNFSKFIHALDSLCVSLSLSLRSIDLWRTWMQFAHLARKKLKLTDVYSFFQSLNLWCFLKRFQWGENLHYNLITPQQLFQCATCSVNYGANNIESMYKIDRATNCDLPNLQGSVNNKSDSNGFKCLMISFPSSRGLVRYCFRLK